MKLTLALVAAFAAGSPVALGTNVSATSGGSENARTSVGAAGESATTEDETGLRGKNDEVGCTPGYDPCIPPGPDVDCAGGRGDGPRYIEGPVYVKGSDPYDLDRDGDGVGCERKR